MLDCYIGFVVHARVTGHGETNRFWDKIGHFDIADNPPRTDDVAYNSSESPRDFWGRFILNNKFKPLVIGLIALGIVDILGVVTMVANPDWTERIIPALVGIQLVGFVVIAFVYWSRAQWNEMETSLSGDVSTKSESAKKPKLRRTRWLWFAMAVVGVLQTPNAIINAIQLVKSDHRMAVVAVLAFAIRFGMIWLFLKLWWQFRPANR